ncbi:MAG: hypothetical protein L0G99_01040 [Propionibacteriales bacterium]|nr:hypothetical protein [Propionibacteriales bacterium]
MTRTHRTQHSTILGLVTAVALLGACTPDTPAPLPPPKSASSSSSASQTPSPTPTPTSTPSADPTKQAVAEAEAAYKKFLDAYTRWMLAGSPKGLTPELRQLASKEALSEIELDGDASREAGVVFRGGPMIVVSLKTELSSSSRASISSCIDQSNFSSSENGKPTEPPRWFRSDSELVRNGTVWTVTKDRGLQAKTKQECTG